MVLHDGCRSLILVRTARDHGKSDQQQTVIHVCHQKICLLFVIDLPCKKRIQTTARQVEAAPPKSNVSTFTRTIPPQIRCRDTEKSVPATLSTHGNIPPHCPGISPRASSLPVHGVCRIFTGSCIEAAFEAILTCNCCHL